MKYLVVIEKAKRNYSAYLPDVPGCVTTGTTEAETLANMKEALEGHLAAMQADGDIIPEPATGGAFIDVRLKAVRTFRVTHARSKQKVV